MRQGVMLAVACGAIGAAALAVESAGAANAWGGSYCMSDREGRSDCSFTSLAQCWASASGTDAGCYARPHAPQQQGASVPLAAPAQSGRAARAGRGG